MGALGFSKNNIMIDFETLGTSENSIVLSMGVVEFNQGCSVKGDYWEFDVPMQILAGRTIDPSSVSWWRRTNPDELLRLLESGQEQLSVMASRLLEFYPRRDVSIWSRGYMDFAILNSILEADAYPYWVHRDVRTMDVFGIPIEKNSHNALEDCRNQVEYVQKVLRRFDG